MDNQSIRVVANITARPEKVEELLAVLHALIGATRKEKGCVSYELLRHKKNSCDFAFVEEWENEAALDAHFATPHMHEALGKLKSLLAADPDIGRYVVVE